MSNFSQITIHCQEEQLVMTDCGHLTILAGTGDGSVTVVPRGDTTYCPISNDSNDCGSTSASLDIFLGTCD